MRAVLSTVAAIAMLTTTAALPAAAAETSAGTGEGRIAFSRLMGDDYEIWTMAADGSDQRRLTNNAVADHNPVWSPDGRTIAWTRFETTPNVGPSDIWLMNADGSNKRALTTSGNAHNPTWSPDGSRIAYERHDYRIVTVKADGSDERVISPAGAFDLEPEWSPDGSRILFGHSGADSIDLWTMKPDGTDRRLLRSTPYLSEHGGSSWSPNARRVAFGASHDMNGWGVYVTNADGTGQRRIAGGLAPEWAPDGRGIVFYSCAFECGLTIVRPDGSGLRPLGQRGFSDTDPDVQPVPAG